GAGFTLVVFDMGLTFFTGRNRHMSVPPAPPSGYAGASRRSNMRRVRLEAAWIRLARRAKTHDAALLVLTPFRASGTAADVVLTARAARTLWASAEDGGPSLLAGIETRLVLEKERGASPGERKSVRLTSVSLIDGLDGLESPALSRGTALLDVPERKV